MQNELSGFRLSPQQRRLWLTLQGRADCATQCAIRLAGPLRAERLQEALRELVARHEILRTTFREVPGLKTPVQVIAEESAFEWRDAARSSALADGEAREVDELFREERERPFDLAHGPLVRALLVGLAPERHLLLLTLHSLCADARTLQNLADQISVAYAGHSESGDEAIEEPMQYVAFAEWQNELLEDNAGEEERQFWRDLNLTETFAHTLPFGERLNGQGHGEFRHTEFNVASHESVFDRDAVARIELAARNAGASVEAFLLACWHALIGRLTGRTETVVGVACDGRKYEELRGALGLFAKHVPVRCRFDEEAGFDAAVREAHEAMLAAEDYQEYFEWGQGGDGGEGGGFPFAFEFAEWPLKSASAGVTFSTLRQFVCLERFGVKLSCVRRGDSLAAEFLYDAGLLGADDVERMAEQFAALVASVLGGAARALGDLEVVGEEERRRLLYDFNRTEADYPLDENLCELFEAQAARTPDAVAVEAEGACLTYGELNARANQLARRLLELGVGPEVLVGVFIRRNVEMMVAVWGVLKSGAAYVPLEPSYPSERLGFMVEDARLRLVLTEQALVEKLPPPRAETLCLDGDWPTVARASRLSRGNLRLAHLADDHLAYVIYTSGSTGTPKGVGVTRRGLMNYLGWAARAYAVAEGRGAPLHSPLAFDLTVTALFPPLLVGQRVALVPEEQGIEGLLGVLRGEGDWSLVKITPAHLDLLNTLLTDGEDMSRWARTFVIGGEALSAESLALWRERAPATRLINEYGPTETVVGCCLHEISTASARAGAVPIGRPIPNTQLYLFNARQRLAPTSVVAELYVGGAGVARGYLHRPELTAERFVPDPFSKEPGARLYRTGDLARHRKDGQLEYLEYIGRMDHQVKVRGFRVELGEIETVLSGHEAVRECAVVVRDEEGRGRRLVAYLVAKDGDRPNVNALREYLAERLPEYMIPAAFVTLKALPLTSNGKVDRRALPAPDHARPELDEEFTEPRTPEERVLSDIWKQVLGVEQIGVHDNFFRLGGDSILSIQIVARANRAGLRLTPQQLFEHQTIAKLAAVSKAPVHAEEDQLPVTGEVRLTPIQHWFFDLSLPNPDHFNQSLLFEPSQQLDATILRAVLSLLLTHHDALRTRFDYDPQQGWRQTVAALDEPNASNAPGLAACFEQIDISAAAEGQQAAALETEAERLQRALDLSHGPLIKLALFELGNRRQRLLIIIHHLVVDGVSWRILLEDLQTAYEQLSGAEGASEARLAPKTSSFQRWSEHLHEYAQSVEVKGEGEYWLRAERAKVKRLPVESSGENLVESARGVTVGLSEERTRLLLREVGRAYATQINEVLLAAVGEALRRWSGERRVLIDVEGHGREQAGVGTPDVSRTVGWFTSSFPLLLTLGNDFDPGRTLKQVKEQLHGVPGRGLGYGLLRYMSDEAVRESLKAMPQAEVSFNYLGQLDRALAADALIAPAPESGGQTRAPGGSRSHLLQINSSVSGERLQLTWGYSEALHRRDTIERVARESLQVLEELIDHCLAVEQRGYTPSDFPLAGLDQPALDRLLEAGGGREAEDIYPLSPLQQGILFHAIHSPESGAYFEQVSLTLKGSLNEDSFRRAWAALVKRHTALRTAFLWELHEKTLQVVWKDAELTWARDDWRGLSEAEQMERLDAFVRAERETGFELSQSPLMRLALMRVEDDAYYFVWSFHHLLLDGWSKNLLLNEFSALYEADTRGTTAALPEPRPFRDYVAWLVRQDKSADEAFWRRQLKGFAAPTPLGGHHSAEGVFDRRGVYSEQSSRLSAETASKLEALGREHELTLNTIMQGAWALLLSQYSGEDDVLFGTVVSGRPAGLDGVEAMVGLFINTLPVRARVSAGAPLGDWLRRLQAQQVEARQFEYTPLAQVQSWSEVPRGRLLFESLFVFENFPVDRSLREAQADLKATNLPSAETTSFPLTVVTGPGAEPVVKIVYDEGRFDAATVSRLLRQFCALLEQFADNPHNPVSALSVITDEESEELIKSFTDNLETF